MVPLLQNTCRSLPIFIALLESISSVTPLKIQLRDVHLNHPVFKSFQVSLKEPKGSARKTLEKKLGFSLTPKKPLSPYFRFMEEVRPSVTAAHPHIKPKELYPVISTMWNSLDATAKEKYVIEYKNELLKYSDIIENYKKQLTEDQCRKIEEKLSAANTRNLIKSYKERARELDKPKRPISSFVKYFHEQRDRKVGEQYKVYMKRMSRRWSRLKRNEKEKYKLTADELENYQKAMLKWEAKITEMIRNGGEETVIYNRKAEDEDDG